MEITIYQSWSTFLQINKVILCGIIWSGDAWAIIEHLLITIIC